jgi:hypothetical protein
LIDAEKFIAASPKSVATQGESMSDICSLLVTSWTHKEIQKEKLKDEGSDQDQRDHPSVEQLNVQYSNFCRIVRVISVTDKKESSSKLIIFQQL